MKREIKLISFPNTVDDTVRTFYEEGKGYVIKEIEKNGEMALIKWFAVYKDNKLVAEIKESVCDIYFK